MLIPSQVQKATIYRDAARVTRTASIDLEKGRTLLEFAELPADLALESLRVRAAGAPGTKLEGYTSKQVYPENTSKKEIQPLVAAVEKLNQSVQMQQSRIASANARNEHLDNLLKETRSFAFGLTNQKLTIAQHFETLEAITGEREKALGERSELQLGLIELQNQFTAKKKELEQLNSQQKTASYQIDLPVVMEAGGTLNVELSYLQPGCSWEPNYDFSLQKGKLEILYTASVSQESGENWQDIDLELSTAIPRTYSDLPEMEPWYLQKYSPPTPRAIPNARMDRMMKSEDDIHKMSRPKFAFYGGGILLRSRNRQPRRVSPLHPSPKSDASQPALPPRFVISNLTLDVEEDRLAIRVLQRSLRRVKLNNNSKLVMLAEAPLLR
jgi:uncharacterized protein (TIGR02231 family)